MNHRQLLFPCLGYRCLAYPSSYHGCNNSIFLGLAYREYLQELKSSCKGNDLEYHVKKADRSLCPRRPDFNRLYSTYCKEKFGAKNGPEMFQRLHEKAEEYMASNTESCVTMQKYEERENSQESQPFILTILTPLMKRVHYMVRKLLRSNITNLNKTLVR